MRTVTLTIVARFNVEFDDEIPAPKSIAESLPGSAEIVSYKRGDEVARTKALRDFSEQSECLNFVACDSDLGRFIDMLYLPIFEAPEPSTKEN